MTQNEDLRAELLRRVERDQVARRASAHAAWLLVQHADADPEFQRRCLDLLTIAAEQGEASKVDGAYLTDRVLLAEGQPQEFGTQATALNGSWAPHNQDQRGVRADWVTG